MVPATAFEEVRDKVIAAYVGLLGSGVGTMVPPADVPCCVNVSVTFSEPFFESVIVPL